VVYIQSNFTVTLTTDVECWAIIHTNGVITVGENNVTIFYGLESYGSNPRTINMGNGVWSTHMDGTTFDVEDTGLTLNPQNSLLVININGVQSEYDPNRFLAGSRSFNDVVINLGVGHSGSNILNITGSPTFRNLIIQSKNNAAHTVVFDDYANVYTKKFVAIGSSASNRLKIVNQSAVSDPDNDYMAGFLYIDTSYGKSVDMRLFSGDYTATESMRPYIGSDSLVPYSWDGDNGGWIAQDPPKIYTLVDHVTASPGI